LESQGRNLGLDCRCSLTARKEILTLRRQPPRESTEGAATNPPNAD